MAEDELPNLLYGTVASVDLAAARITVRLGEVESGPIRWFERAAGGTRTWSPPKLGEQVLLLAPQGDIAGAIALRGVICTPFPAAGDSARELIQFEDGAILAYDPEAHALEAILPAGATVRIEADGGITIKGDVTIEGNLTASEDVKAGEISLKDHKHGQVQAGGAQSGRPV